MASRDIKDLTPHMQELANAHVAACKAQGLDLLIYCTYRSPEEQDELYSCGRTTKGAIVTNCRGGQSMHNKRLAYDCVPLIGGKPQWSDKVLYAKVGAIGESVGLTWSGRWAGSLKEVAHFQDGK